VSNDEKTKDDLESNLHLSMQVAVHQALAHDVLPQMKEILQARGDEGKQLFAQLDGLVQILGATLAAKEPAPIPAKVEVQESKGPWTRQYLFSQKALQDLATRKMEASLEEIERLTKLYEQAVIEACDGTIIDAANQLGRLLKSSSFGRKADKVSEGFSLIDQALQSKLYDKSIDKKKLRSWIKDV